MNDSGPLTLRGVERIASELGLDLAKLREDTESTKIRDAIEHNKQLAETIRVASTPTFVVAGELLTGLSDGTELQALIEKAEQALRK
jgi:protein-disulfide isomerase